MRRLRTWVLLASAMFAGVAAAAVTGCASAGTPASPAAASTAANSTPPSASQPANTSADTTPGSSPASGTPGTGGLGAKVVPAPSGFTLSEMPDVHNGPLSAAEFDRSWGDPAGDHFVRGYHVTYDSSDGSTSIEVAVFEFATPAGAAAFKADFVSGELIKSKADPVIPAADDFDASPGDVGIYNRGVIATKGNQAFVITGTTNSADPVPVVQTMARQQYAAL